MTNLTQPDPPKIWVDNDGCPRAVRELVCLGAKARQFKVLLVANRHPGQLEFNPWVEAVVVSGSFDAADDHIAEHIRPGDLVVTSDVPLANRVILGGAVVLTSKGETFDSHNIGEKLAIRNLSQELRSAGDLKGGPPPWGPQDKKRFADALDRNLTRLKNNFNDQVRRYQRQLGQT